MSSTTKFVGQMKITLFEPADGLVSLKEASVWASEFLKRNVSESNISYFVPHG